LPVVGRRGWGYLQGLSRSRVHVRPGVQFELADDRRLLGEALRMRERSRRLLQAVYGGRVRILRLRAVPGAQLPRDATGCRGHLRRAPVCQYADPCCNNAYCDGTSWSLLSCESPYQGGSCYAAALNTQSVCPVVDGGTRTCVCAAPEGVPFWDCADHSGGYCPPNPPQTGSVCVHLAGVRCDYAGAGQPLTCTCHGNDAEFGTWDCVAP
jgi:hypothetical protein